MHGTAKRLTSLILDTLPPKTRIQRSYRESLLVPSLTTCDTTTDRPLITDRNSRTLLLRFIFSIPRLPEIVRDHKKVLPFFIYGVFEYFLPIALLKNRIVHASWVTFSSSALYRDPFWFFYVPLLLPLHRRHFSTPSNHSIFSLRLLLVFY